MVKAVASGEDWKDGREEKRMARKRDDGERGCRWISTAFAIHSVAG